MDSGHCMIKMNINYKLLDNVNQLPLDRFEVKPDASIFESWDFLQLGHGENSKYFSRGRPGNPHARGKQLKIEIDLTDWQNQDRSKTYLAIAHKLDLTRQSEYVGKITKCDVLFPHEQYSFVSDNTGDASWAGEITPGLTDDATVSVEICHVQDQELNATASVKCGWQGRFYVVSRILVDRSLMETISGDINSGNFHRLTVSVLISPWRLLEGTFKNLVPTDDALDYGDGYDFPKISETCCSDMFRFTLEPSVEEKESEDQMSHQSNRIKELVEISRHLRTFVIVNSVLLLALVFATLSQ
ncbi:MAG: hypothetical protein CMK29_00820 [Porticoccaceae bacterium]|nr:hypothetical protein [Porticoccaceae bacterium]|tara:strand:- start:332 stop:1231 length:900 start_codon:yes stop_codon:yes gene_type:complete